MNPRCGAICARVGADGQVFDHVECYLPAGHYYAQRHEGSAADVAGFQWNDADSIPGSVPDSGEAAA